MTVFQVSITTPSNGIYWDNDESYLGLGSSSPRYQIDVVDNGNYAVRGMLSNNSTGAATYANWGAANGAGIAVFGIGGVGFTTLPNLVNRAYMFADTGTDGCVIYNQGNVPIRFAIGSSVTGQWNVGGGFNVVPGTPSTHNDGDIWYDGTNLKMKTGTTIKTFTLT